MRLFHKEVFWPAPLERLMPRGVQNAIYSNHAHRAAQNDRYGHIMLPKFFNLDEAYIFEAECYGPDLKVVFRYPYDEVFDLVVAAIPQRRSGLYVKTVWLNARTDNHKTLDKEKYTQC